MTTQEAAIKLSKIAISLGLAAGFTLGLPGIANADDPVDLNGAYVLDNSGVVTGQETQIKSALDKLFDSTGIKLYVVYVDEFDGAADGEWANETADANGFGNDDVLLAIATESRNYQVSYPADFAKTQSETDSIETEFLVPKLRANDWAGAAIAFANGLAGEKNPETQPGASAGGGFPWLPVGGVVVVGGTGAYLYVRHRRKGKLAQASQADLDRQAGGLLVDLDDAISTSEQELGFATAQFGDSATKQFASVLDEAKAKIAQAFKIRQQLDDAIPESPEDKRKLTQQIIELCTKAGDDLTAQSKAFDDLRQLEKDLPAAQEKSAADLKLARSQSSGLAKLVVDLREKYSASAIAAVSGNPDQAKKLISFAESALSESEKAASAGDNAKAAVSLRAAQQSIGQAKQLSDAVSKLSGELKDASTNLSQALSKLRADIAAADALPDGQGLLKAAVASASSVAQSADGSDPVAQLASIQSAATQLDKALGDARSEQERISRAKSDLASAISTARAKISTATDFITTRRGGIAETARTRLSEARRRLDSAAGLASSDPIAALTEAQAAADLADQALDAAQSDVSSWNPGGGFDPSILGAGLGGLLGGSLSGPFGGTGRPRGQSGWPGGNRGGFGGGGGFGGPPFGRSSGSGNLGSGSRGGRRSSGGRF